MNEIKLSEDEFKTIKNIFNDLYPDKIFGDGEMKPIFYEGINSLLNNMFFASSSLLFLFLEVYLRNLLVLNYLKKKTVGLDGFMSELEKVEEQIEDEKKENKNLPKYGFIDICEYLLKVKILDNKLYLRLKEIYKEIRNPIQHGCYSRLNRSNQVDENIYMFGSDGELTEESLLEAIKSSPNTFAKLNNPIIRMVSGSTQEILKNKCIELLFLILELINFTSKEENVE